jgi:Flp pilus assembly protein TadD
MASLQIRVKKNEDAVKAATRCTMLAPEYPDGYLLLGIANMELGNKDEAKKALEKAKTLGDKRADEYLKKI